MSGPIWEETFDIHWHQYEAALVYVFMQSQTGAVSKMKMRSIEYFVKWSLGDSRFSKWERRDFKILNDERADLRRVCWGWKSVLKVGDGDGDGGLESAWNYRQHVYEILSMLDDVTMSNLEFIRFCDTCRFGMPELDAWGVAQEPIPGSTRWVRSLGWVSADVPYLSTALLFDNLDLI